MAETIEPDFLGLTPTDFISCIEQGILTENHLGKITFANQKMLEMLGYSISELAGKDWTEIVPAQKHRRILKRLKIRTGDEKKEHEIELLTKSGKRIPVIVCARPVFQSERSDAEQYQGAVSTFIDITNIKRIEKETESRSEQFKLMNRALNLQRKKLTELTEKLAEANEELKRLSEAKSDFVSAVSHDLRAPLTTIIEGMCLVEDGTLGEVNEEQKKFLKLAIEDAEHLNDFINDILDLAKIEAGKILPKRTKVSPKKQIERIKLTYKKYIQEKGLSLTIDLPTENIEIFCDPSHYNRILNNLLSNAIKFTPNKGKIEIKVETKIGEMVLTQVKDTGIGIPSEQRHLIFQKFEQVERSARKPGSGLGLSLCKQLAELNDGEIGFESEVSRGSNFYFTLPAYNEIIDLNFALKTISSQTKLISGHTVAFLFKFSDEAIKNSSSSCTQGLDSNANTLLNKIAQALQPKTLSYDIVKIFPKRRELILVSALPEEKAKTIYSDLVETVQKLGLDELSASFYVCPDVSIDADNLLRILETQLKSIK